MLTIRQARAPRDGLQEGMLGSFEDGEQPPQPGTGIQTVCQ
jgi:hypothetical protein